MRKTFLITFLLLSAVFGKGIVKNPPPTSPTPPTQTPSDCFGRGCLIIANCRFYQIDENLLNYKCAACNAGFTLNTTGGPGVCKAGNAIANCIQTQIHSGQPVCFECAAGYVLSFDLKQCTLPTTNPNITNCLSFVFNQAGQVTCLVCNSNFTVNPDGTACLPGCPITNCANCVQIPYDTNTYCYNCAAGTIGVQDPNNFLFTRCLTCAEWSNLLLAPATTP